MWLPDRYAAAVIPGAFTAASGIQLPYKIDLPLVYTDPLCMQQITQDVGALIPEEVTHLAAVGGAIPIAESIADARGIRCLYAEKIEGGGFRLLTRVPNTGCIVIVEDVVSTGGTADALAALIRSQNQRIPIDRIVAFVQRAVPLRTSIPVYVVYTEETT